MNSNEIENHVDEDISGALKKFNHTVNYDETDKNYIFRVLDKASKSSKTMLERCNLFRIEHEWIIRNI